MGPQTYGAALLSLQLAACALGSTGSTHATYTIPSTAQLGASSMQTRSSQGPLDGPKLDFVNGTSFDFWYFDVTSYDNKASIVLAFYAASNYALGISPNPPSRNETINMVTIYGSFPNGTLFATQIEAGEAKVRTERDGSSGNWTGEIRMKSRSPAHYLGAPASTRDVSEELQPNIGWANAVPDAHTFVEANIQGSPLVFTGSGYHDKNWGNRPLNTVAKWWIWGHASVGPFSLVFWHIISNEGSVVDNLYLTRDRKVIALGASTLESGPGDSFTLSIDSGDNGRFRFVEEPSVPILNTTGLTRWVGTMKGAE
ncbi:hypothetical protein BS47DRAFT_1379551 [Hydnum rufescens UP504]|uniref:Hydroxyneurosporene synthase n=1 Tax=Hydnum rufescens UP504 TaxID=1448309 RepID=A0A9P6B834_9AGAM|nr:hypothetical protein BS47DRAFT_1379551 [Hydnum rufescens UP504]